MYTMNIVVIFITVAIYIRKKHAKQLEKEDFCCKKRRHYK